MAGTIIGLLNPAIAAIFAAIFVGVWLRDRSAIHVLALAAGYVGLAAGFVILHYAPTEDPAAWVMLMHAIYSVSVICVSWAAARRSGQLVRWPALAAISLIGGLLMLISGFGDDMTSRLLAANTAYGLMFALTAQILGRSGKRDLVDRAVYWLFVITAAQFIIRPQLSLILSGPVAAESYRTSEVYAAWLVTMGVISLMLALTLVAAVVSDLWRNERDKAELDHLTGLKMRGAFEAAAMKTLDENADRRVPVSMIVADIDHFKQVNDTFGHQAGDSAIAGFGELIAATVRECDLCGRVGGEEFCILVWNCDLSGARNLAERLRRSFRRLEHDGLPSDVRLTSSFGVAQSRQGEGYGKLFARADKALYDAKHEGRDRVVTSGQVDVVQDIREVRVVGSEPDATVASA